MGMSGKDFMEDYLRRKEREAMEQHGIIPGTDRYDVYQWGKGVIHGNIDPNDLSKKPDVLQSNVEIANEQIEEMLKNPNLFPALVGFTGLSLTLFLASNKDVLKAIIRAVGNIPPDSLEADIL